MNSTSYFDGRWTKRAFSEIGPTLTYLEIEEIEGIPPLDTQFGADRRKTIPDSLIDLIFGQRTPKLSLEFSTSSCLDHTHQAELTTYALLDAARIPNLVETLNTSGLEHDCLFHGDSYEQYQDVAPWVVQLEHENGFTRSLFTKSDAKWDLWGGNSTHHHTVRRGAE